MSAARRRFTTCRCCGGLTASSLCDPCGSHHAQRIAVVQAAILALWGSAGAVRYETELRARRLASRRATRPGRKAS